MPSIPDDVRANLEARTSRAFKGFLALGFLLVPLTIGFSLVWVVWAFVHRKQARYLLEHGEMVKVRPTHARRTADEAMSYDVAQVIGFMGYERTRIFMKILAFLGRIVPTIIVGGTIESDGRKKEFKRYVFSNERIDFDENDEAWMLANPKCPTVHGWIVSRIPENDRGILPASIGGGAPASGSASEAGSAGKPEQAEASDEETVERRKAA